MFRLGELERGSAQFTKINSVQFNEGIAASSELLGEVNWKMVHWIHSYRFLFSIAKARKYFVRFNKRKEIFDLIECQIEAAVGVQKWEGSALGINCSRAFELAFPKIKHVKYTQPVSRGSRTLGDVWHTDLLHKSRNGKSRNTASILSEIGT